ncbi:PqqD family peptide modification chaperone [Prauserella marina]|uniref:PqqD family peptide modification chaperone n=1 Tax=Prauserella marina TaxID=530584 RepID=UPI001475C2ED|nr:PqqD family peptide modification chaperone [Prauserella marina]
MSTAQVSDGLVVVDERRGRTVHLNTTAATMLRALLAGGQDAAITVVCQRFGVTEDTARDDLSALITDLARRKLVRR